MNNFQALLSKPVTTTEVLDATEHLGDMVDYWTSYAIDGIFDSPTNFPEFACVLTGIWYSGLYNSELSDASKGQLANLAYSTLWPYRGSLTAVQSWLDVLISNNDIPSNATVREYGNDSFEYPGINPGQVYVTFDLPTIQRSSLPWQIAQNGLNELVSVLVERADVVFSYFHADYSLADEPLWS